MRRRPKGKESKEAGQENPQMDKVIDPQATMTGFPSTMPGIEIPEAKEAKEPKGAKEAKEAKKPRGGATIAGNPATTPGIEIPEAEGEKLDGLATFPLPSKAESPSGGSPAKDAPPVGGEGTEIKTQEISVSQILPMFGGPPAPPPGDAAPRALIGSTTKRTRRLRALNKEALRGASPQNPTALKRLEPGAYERAEELGRGRISQIVKAREKRFSRVVALKEAVRGVSAEDFLREARMAARLQHAGILPVYDLGCWPEGDPVYVTRLFPGKTLDELGREARGPEERLALLPCFLPAVQAIAYVHKERIAHLDLRPKNILVNELGESVVIGWSLARGLDQAEPLPPAQTSSTLEEMVYRPAEQAGGGALDERADVYSLGATLYHLLSGREPPFPQDLVSKPAGASLLARAPWVPLELVAIVERAMHFNQEQRYPDAGALAADLVDFEGARLAAAYRPHLIVRVLRSLRRHWLLAALTFALIAALAFGFGFTLKLLGETKDAAAKEREDAAAAYAAAKDAEELAESRTAGLTLSFASNALARDPTEALAWLKSLPDVRSAVTAARLIAAEAKERGVARHLLKGQKGPILRLASSPKSPYLASAGEDGSILLWETSPLGERVGESYPLLGHEDAVERIVFSPDGLLLASASKDKTVRLWDVSAPNASTPVRPQVLTGHTEGVFDVVFSPDGKLLASVGGDGAAYLWEVACAAPGQAAPCAPRQVFLGEEGALYVVRFSPDSKSLAFAGKDKKLYLARVAGGAPKALGEHYSEIWDLAFSPDGKTLISAGRDRTVRLWDLATSQVKALWGHGDDVLDIELSPDGRLLASASFDGTVRLWDRSDDNKSRVFRGHKDRVVRVIFSPDGQELASASTDGTVWRWSLACLLPAPTSAPDGAPRAAGDCGPLQVLRGHEGALSDVAFSKIEDAQLFSAGRDASIRIWDISKDESSTGRGALVGEHKGDVRRVAFSPDGSFLASASEDKTVLLWDLASDNQAPRVLQGHIGGVAQVVFSPDGSLLVSAGKDKSPRLWDLTADTPSSRALSGHKEDILDAAFSPDGKLLATASADKTVRLWDIAKDTSQVYEGHEDEVLDVAFSPDGKWLASASKDKTLRLWAVQGADKAASAHTLSEHKDVVYALAFSPDGKWLASASKDKTVILWALGAGAPTLSRVLAGHEGEVFGVSFSPDGKLLASASEDKDIRLWDTQTGQSRVFDGHEDAIYQITFSSDGAYLASASKDKTVRLWDTQTGQSQVFHGHEDAVLDVAFSPDGKLLASASKDEDVRFFSNELPLQIEGLQAWLGRVTTVVLNEKNQLAPKSEE